MTSFFAGSNQHGTENWGVVLDTLDRSGLRVSKNKSLPEPGQVIKHLNDVLDILRVRLFVPENTVMAFKEFAATLVPCVGGPGRLQIRCNLGSMEACRGVLTVRHRF